MEQQNIELESKPIKPKIIQKPIPIRRLEFGAFMKLAMLAGLSSGIVMGIFMFVLSALGGNVYANVGPIRLTGFYAGLVNLILAPVLTSIIVAWFALIAYLPLKLYLKIFKNTRFTALIDYIEPETEEQMQQSKQND